MNTLDHFEKIIELVKEDGLTDLFFETAREHIDTACALLKVSPVQAVFFALVLEHFGETVSVDNIAEIVKCSKIQLLKYIDEFDALRHKRLIRVSSDDLFGDRDNYPEYKVPMEVIHSIRNNKEYRNTDYDNMTPEAFFEYAENLLKAAKNDELSLDSWKDEMDDLFICSKNITFVQKKDEYKLSNEDAFNMLVFCTKLVNNDERTIGADDLLRELRDIWGSRKARSIMSSLKSRQHELSVKGLIEFDCQNGMADTKQYCLSQKAKDEFLSDVDIMKNTKRSGKDYICFENIPVKKLFYSEKIRDCVNELEELLREDNFSCIQKRLEESGMRTGFACIFSGLPGTGKTETVYQIARKTGRDIMLVNIAETKSLWFGESEKRIKAVFDRYRAVVNNGGPAPILFFNEADAVLGKRRELSRSKSGPDQTENAIQNIILQEMENLNGILIATTNMTANFDSAFERRFLYKIEFEKPDAESKKLMWRSFIPSLCDSDAAYLAREFDFSGGQIENIARKSTVSFILKGKAPDVSVLERFCSDEPLIKSAVTIGFRV